MIPGEAYVALAVLIMGAGAYGLIANRNVIKMLISVEVMFNAALLLLLTAAASLNPIEGSLLAIFAIALASAEIGVIIPIALLMFRVFGSTDVSHVSRVKG